MLFLQRQLSTAATTALPQCQAPSVVPGAAAVNHCASPIPLLVFSICHYSTYTLGPTLKISPRLLPGRPTKGPATQALPHYLCMPRDTAWQNGAWPLTLCAPPPRRHQPAAAFLPPCSLLVQTLFCTRLPHVPITLLGSGFFKRRQTTDAAARTRVSSFPSPFLNFSS